MMEEKTLENGKKTRVSSLGYETEYRIEAIYLALIGTVLIFKLGANLSISAPILILFELMMVIKLIPIWFRTGRQMQRIKISADILSITESFEQLGYEIKQMGQGVYVFNSSKILLPNYKVIANSTAEGFELLGVRSILDKISSMQKIPSALIIKDPIDDGQMTVN